MLFKIIISFLCVVLFFYLLLCLFLNTPIVGGGNVKELPKDVEHRWFWVMSIYVGKVIMFGLYLLVLAFFTMCAYILIYGS